MGGRGRGRAALSFNIESLGITPGEQLPGPVLQPPPLYPSLEFNPTPLLPSLDHMQQLKYKTDYLAFYSRLKVECGEKEMNVASKRKSGVCLSAQAAKPVHLDYYWERFPMELRPVQHKKRAAQESSKPTANIDEILDHLEKAEGFVKKEKENKEENEEKPREEEEVEDSDNEMDGGTDYNQNYFDNGEGYLDEDEDVDDGPIY